MYPTSSDIEKMRLPAHRVHDMAQKRAKIPRHKPGQKFLKGPIPMDWLIPALKLPGKALHVSVMLWFYASLKRSGEVALSLSRLKEVGVSRSSASRALVHLEKAGLVAVSRGAGRKPVVRLLEVQNQGGITP